MKAQIVRTGGFAGIQMTTSVDSDTLEPEVTKQLRQIIKNAGFFALPTVISAGNSQADRFQYKITVQDGNKSHTVTVSESSLSGGIKQLVEFMNRNSKR